MLERSPVERAPTRVGAVMASLKAASTAARWRPARGCPRSGRSPASLAVSKSTVVEAYDRLVAEGAVVARRGAGFFVAGPTRPLVLARAVRAARAGGRLAVVDRAALEADPDVVQPGSGWLPKSWMPEVGMQRALRDLARDRAFRKTQYDSPIGYAPLRRQLAVRLGERGVVASPEQIVLTNSTTQAIDLAMRFLVQPGDTVAVDDPELFPSAAAAQGASGRTSSPRR